MGQEKIGTGSKEKQNRFESGDGRVERGAFSFDLLDQATPEA